MDDFRVSIPRSSGFDDPITVVVQRRIYRLRPHDERPLSPFCKPHLRRSCGTCAGFPTGAALSDRAQFCALKSITVNGPDSAAHCKIWTRKSAPQP
jgi:hypothetical protein